MNEPRAIVDDSAARQALFGLLSGCTSTQILHAAVRTGLVDALGKSPLDATALAERVGSEQELVLRLLRGLVVRGLVDERDGGFVAKDLLDLLRPDTPGYLRDAALFWGSQAYGAWAELAHTTSTGDPAFDLV